MDGTFSKLQTKCGSAKTCIINELKVELNLLRTKCNEMNFSFTPKFYLLYEHAADFLRGIKRFFDIGEDAVERWYQIRICYHARM